MKILILGIDGGSWEIINMGVSENKLPTFKYLIENGVHGTLRSTIPPRTLPAVPSFITGKNPGKVGIDAFLDGKTGRVMSSLDIRESALWDILSRHNLRCCVVGVPLTYPAKEINGVMISGPPLPSSDCDFTWPRELKSEIDYPVESAGREGLEETVRSKGVGYLFDKYRSITKKSLDIFKELVVKGDYDFSIFFVKGSDILQHFLWEEKHLLLEYHQIIDIFLNEMLDSGDYDLVFIISDHGFERESEYFHINSWLEKERYLFVKKPIRFLHNLYRRLEYAPRLRALALKGLALFNFLLRSKKGKTLQAVIEGKKRVDDLFAESGGAVFGVDMKKTIAWSQRGYGIEVKTGLGTDRYHQVREEIIKKLSDLKVNGKKIVRMVKRREEEYTGNYINRFPDIIFLTEEGIVPRVSLAKQVVVVPKHRIRTGQHDSAVNGIFIAYGNSIKKGAETEKARIYDIAPTILHAFGLPIPKDMDGRVLKEIFTEGSDLALREIGYQEIDVERERQRIRERIRKTRGSGRLNQTREHDMKRTEKNTKS
jgi:predicted AlkP superfamily phosphohydrolase/phosphomutase